MAKITQKQMEMFVDFAAAQVRFEKWDRWAWNAICVEKDDAKYMRASSAKKRAATEAVAIARQLGMTDDQINQCESSLLIWAETTEARA